MACRSSLGQGTVNALAVIAFLAGVEVWIAGGVTDMRRGMNTLAFQVQEGMARSACRRELLFPEPIGNPIELLWRNGAGMTLHANRLEKGKRGTPDLPTLDLCPPWQALCRRRADRGAAPLLPRP